MKLVKIFIAFTFLLAFALQVSAQDKTPKIVWTNLQEKYEKFEDIKPFIVNVSDSPIFFYDPYYSVKLAYLDESKDEWNTIYFFICGTGLKLTPLKLIPQSDYPLNLEEVFWKKSTKVEPSGIDHLENLRNIGVGRFRLEIHYKHKKAKVEETETSPEFQVKVRKNN